jgi:hypothetical protein
MNTLFLRRNPNKLMTKRARINSKDKVAEEIVKTICIPQFWLSPLWQEQMVKSKGWLMKKQDK